MLSQVRRTIRQVAAMQLRDMERVLSRSGVLSSRMWRLMSKVLNDRSTFDYVYDEELRGAEEAVVSELTDLMVYAYLLRTKLTNRRRSTAKSLVLASVSPEVRKLSKQIELNLDNLRDKFTGLAGRNVRRSLSDLRATVNDVLQKASANNETFEAATRSALRRLRKHGLAPRSSSYIETLVRTQGSIAYNAAHFLETQGDPDLWGYEYVTMGDDRVREEHEDLDGTRRKYDDDFWSHFWPPNGWNCRCQVVPIYIDEDGESPRQTPVSQNVDIDQEWDFNPAEFI